MDHILDTLTGTETIALYHALAAELWKAQYRHMPRVMGYEKIKPLLDEEDAPADPRLVEGLRKRTIQVRTGREPRLYGLDEAAAFLGRIPLAVWYAIGRGDLPRHGGSAEHVPHSGETIQTLYLWEDELIAFQRGRPMPPEQDEDVMDANEAARYLFGEYESGRPRLRPLYEESDAGRIRHFRASSRYLYLRSDLLEYQRHEPDPNAYGKRPEDKYIELVETSAAWVQDLVTGRWGFEPVGRWVVTTPDGRRYVHPSRTEPTYEEMRKQLNKARYRVRKTYPAIGAFSVQE